MRPSSSAVRLAGVTRSASITPARHSATRPNPANSAPKMPSCTSRPGTKIVYALSAPNVLASGSSSGPNRLRYRIGCTSPMITQAGLRSAMRSCR